MAQPQPRYPLHPRLRDYHRRPSWSSALCLFRAPSSVLIPTNGSDGHRRPREQSRAPSCLGSEAFEQTSDQHCVGLWVGTGRERRTHWCSIATSLSRARVIVGPLVSCPSYLRRLGDPGLDGGCNLLSTVEGVYLYSRMYRCRTTWHISLPRRRYSQDEYAHTSEACRQKAKRTKSD